jgi:hypothetical protein
VHTSLRFVTFFLPSYTLALKMLRHVRAQSAVYVLGMIIVILSSIGLYTLGPTLETKTFLGWERAVFWLLVMLIVYSALGCIAMTCARLRTGDSTTTPTWAYFSAGMLLSMGLLYSSLQTSFVQGGTWVELKHNWNIVRYRFPQYKNMNTSAAIPAAGRYYKGTVAGVGALLWALFFLVSTTTVCAGRALECRKVSKYILHITGTVGMVVSAVLAGYAISMAGKPDQFGLTAHIPFKTGVVAGFLFAASLAGVVAALKHRTTVYYVAQFILLGVTVIVLLGCFVSSYIYAQGILAEFEDVPDTDLDNATRVVGIQDMRWTKADFKLVVKTHFASVGVFAVFVTIVVIAVYSAAIYSCCNIRQGWRKKRYLALCNCTNCRCTRCVKMFMKCGPECGACCANCCDLKGDEDDRMLTGV